MSPAFFTTELQSTNGNFISNIATEHRIGRVPRLLPDLPRWDTRQRGVGSIASSKAVSRIGFRIKSRSRHSLLDDQTDGFRREPSRKNVSMSIDAPKDWATINRSNGQPPFKRGGGAMRTITKRNVDFPSCLILVSLGMTNVDQESICSDLDIIFIKPD